MGNYRIFVGNIKKCLNVSAYKEFGDQYMAGDFKTAHTVCGSSVKTIEVIEEDAHLLEISKDRYVKISEISTEGKKPKLLFDSSSFVFHTEPSANGDLFVTDLQNTNEKCSIKRLKLK